MKKFNIGIVGATGLVGSTILNLLDSFNFPVNSLTLFSSSKSLNLPIIFKTNIYKTELINESSFKKCDIIFFASTKEISKKYVKIAAKYCFVIDSSSFFRLDKNIPLIIPEINSNELTQNNKIIASPNCSTTIALLSIYNVHKIFKIKNIIISTYQAVSGAGKQAMKELNDKNLKNTAFNHSISQNVIPHIDIFEKNMYTKEEMKIVLETRKILKDKNINIDATCVRVPTIRSHAMSILINTKNPITINDFKICITNQKGIHLLDNPKANLYPMPLNTSNKNDVFVGRVRKSHVFANGINFWVCGDQILKGAALNAVQISFHLIENFKI